ncbi:class I adenylate-forming enzyme family protein [Chelatococcus reniformis]|uniref:3-methylmercaptopropionyl-CoA ligase n=1 Tax=Chelatococcus reniformis TaxID=1494448 RepID=A0A916UW09_9HYPH|nr:AMP-binding protein [Chelatococcus reniformis]GGC89504.1 AMP-binding protein [Chelatococcus reniformis]
MQTFVDLAARLEARGSSPALVCQGRAHTAGALADEAGRIARALMAAGVGRGERVCVWLPNGPEFVLIELATAMIGAVFVPIHTRYGSSELANILGQAEPAMLVYQRAFLQADLDATLLKAAPQVAAGAPQAAAVRFVSLDGSRHAGVTTWSDLLAGADAVPESALEAARAAVRPDDPAVCIFTSGTTGVPKGAMLSHRAILTTEQRVGDAMGIADGDRVLYAAPLPSVFGCCNALVATWSHDACLVLMPTFEAGEALATIEAERCTMIYGVPTMFVMLLGHPAFAAERTRSLRGGIVGGAPCAPALAEAIMHDLGVKDLVSGYGMSETCAVISITRIGDPPPVVAQTVGRPLPGVEIRIVDPAADVLVAAEEGEICIRGINLMLGYFGGSSGLKRPFPDGWFRTGDLGTIDADGNLRITGRCSDMILVGGFNVYPVEIEALLARHPAVSQAHVVGIPDERMGERPVAFVQLDAHVRVGAEELAQYCTENIAKYKVPARFIFVDDFPMTPLGKIQKFELKKMATQVGA